MNIKDFMPILVSGIKEETGLIFESEKLESLEIKVVKRAHLLGFAQAEDYIPYYQKNVKAELAQYIAVFTTHYTSFYRESVHFDILKAMILKVRGCNKSFVPRVWVAATSTGEESYSIACVLEKMVTDGLLDFYEIVCTDIDVVSLETAETGIYLSESVRKIPFELIRNNWLQGTNENAKWMKIGPHIKKKLRFLEFNLLKTSPEILCGNFDFVFCRNVCLYFTEEQIEQVARMLAAQLKPEGKIFIGLSENLSLPGCLVSHGSSVFSKQELDSVHATINAASSADLVAKASHWDKALASSVLSIKMQKFRVLVIDDSRAMTSFLSKAIGCGYHLMFDKLETCDMS